MQKLQQLPLERYMLTAISALLSLLLLGISGCTDEVPPGGTATDDSSTRGLATETSQSPLDTSLERANGNNAEPGSSGDPTHAGTPTTAWGRAELIDGVGSFIHAIDSNDQEAFYSALAERSTALIEHDPIFTRERVWQEARSSLAGIRNRKITVIGGTRDSVALRIDGERMNEGIPTKEPLVMSLLREQGMWRVMYPGLGHPDSDLRR